MVAVANLLWVFVLEVDGDSWRDLCQGGRYRVIEGVEDIVLVHCC